MNIFTKVIFIILYVYLLLSKSDKYDVYALKNFNNALKLYNIYSVTFLYIKTQNMIL